MKGVFYFGAGNRNEYIFCPLGAENRSSHQCLHWCQQGSTGALHYEWFASGCKKTKDTHGGCLLLWCRQPESNRYGFYSEGF